MFHCGIAWHHGMYVRTSQHATRRLGGKECAFELIEGRARGANSIVENFVILLIVYACSFHIGYTRTLDHHIYL
jgi:hypothetical protein